MPYNDSRIENWAKEYGYKTANLMYLKDIISSTANEKIKTEIPSFVAIKDEITRQHLSDYAPGWENAWNEFVAIIARDGTRRLSDQAKIGLTNIQKLILKCFTEHPISTENLSAFIGSELKETDLVMVRSTGKEDSTDLSNPGGNESVPSEVKDISSSIAKVIASYFGEKSFTQRLNGGDDITKFPFMPVLVQKMIRETKNNAVISGVIYSDNGSTRIQAAPGHGELIVNSKGNFDNYYITTENMIYADLRTKDKRLVTKWDGNATELVFRDNSNLAKYNCRAGSRHRNGEYKILVKRYLF